MTPRSPVDIPPRRERGDRLVRFLILIWLVGMACGTLWAAFKAAPVAIRWLSGADARP